VGYRKYKFPRYENKWNNSIFTDKRVLSRHGEKELLNSMIYIIEVPKETVGKVPLNNTTYVIRVAEWQ